MDFKETIKELRYSFLAGIREPVRIMAPFRWPGGKGNLASWIVKYVSDGRIYVEPFAGAASVFWHLPKPFPVEVLNDIDGDIVNFYRILQDKDKFEILLHRLVFTPYARAEFRRALRILRDPKASDIDRAWAFFVRQNQSISGAGRSEGNWSRSITDTRNGMASTTSKFRSRLKLLAQWHDRISRVQIDNIDGIECIRYWDTMDTVFYVAPPYVLETRRCRSLYRNEIDLSYHERLVETLLHVKGKVLLSCYDHPVYKPLTDAGWHKITKDTVCHMIGKNRNSRFQGIGNVKVNAPRTETLYMNFKHNQDIL
jgi:DNA adenine methylase